MCSHMTNSWLSQSEFYFIHYIVCDYTPNIQVFIFIFIFILLMLYSRRCPCGECNPDIGSGTSLQRSGLTLSDNGEELSHSGGNECRVTVPCHKRNQLRWLDPGQTEDVEWIDGWMDRFHSLINYLSLSVLKKEDLDVTEDRVVFGTENNSTFLECVPRSPQATVTWLVQRDDHKEEVRFPVNNIQVRINTIKGLSMSLHPK